MWEKFAAWMGQYWWIVLVAAALVAALVTVCVAASKARKKDGQKAESGGENASADAASPKGAQRERGDAEVEATPAQPEDENAVETEPAESFEDAAYFVTEGEAVPPGKRLPVYRVHYDRAGATWVVKKDGNERVTRRTATKAEALEAAKELCRRQDAALTVQKKDGKFQKRRNAK